MQRLGNPFPLFLDTRGAVLDAGYIYVGVAGEDPTTDPIDLYLNQALTQPIAQPLRTLGGFIVNDEIPVFVYLEEDDYSLLIQDVNHQQVAYAASNALAEGVEYQPLSDNLTDLSGQVSTAYGRTLLNLANQAALQAAVGTPTTFLAKTGGTMTGDITRSGKGVYTYHNDPALTSGRIFVTAAGAADPTSLPGDIWLEKQ